jgi:hypothetical protein
MTGAPLTGEPLFRPDEIDRSGWPESTLRDPMHLMEMAEEVDRLEDLRHDMHFRGQANASYSLSTSLARICIGLPVELVFQIEIQLLADFARRSDPGREHAIILDPFGQPLRYWMRMQHHGAPTRLLDWTSSLFVATYFACIDAHDEDGAVWFFRGEELDRRMIMSGAKSFDEATSSHDVTRTYAREPWCYAFSAARPTERMLAQRGSFTVAVDPHADHAALIHNRAHNESRDNCTHQRIRIPKELKPRILHRLHSMNITAGTLFPGIDGVGRSIRERAILLRYALRDDAVTSLDIESSPNAPSQAYETTRP